MQITMFKSKIHRDTVTEADLNYEGSLTVDSSLMEMAKLREFEQVHVVKINTGARLGAPGDKIIVIFYAQMGEEKAKDFEPTVVLVDENNKVKTPA